MDHDTQGPEMLCGAIVASDDAAEDIEMALAGSANQRQFIEDVVALVARFDHWSGPPTICKRQFRSVTKSRFMVLQAARPDRSHQHGISPSQDTDCLEKRRCAGDTR